jgi:predicted SAM-dependent methyltransferase
VNLIKLAKYAIAGWLPFGQHHCVVCGHDVWRFMPYGNGWSGLPALMSALDVVGSDPENFECPRCGAHDRERHLLMYLEATGLLATMQGKSILHFAPEKRLVSRIQAVRPGQHVRCDLYPQSPDVVRVDMLAMQFETGSFDMLIANHVLEHVADEIQALREIRRVLKVGGYAILQTPYSRKLHGTWQDAGIADGEARLQAYGQADHVRLYGRDIFDRFASVGFVSRVQEHAELLATVDPRRYGVNPNEPFMLFERFA